MCKRRRKRRSTKKRMTKVGLYSRNERDYTRWKVFVTRERERGEKNGREEREEVEKIEAAQ